ncbi:hypothetical protein GGC63_002909 [Paenibacillus sp. OAS669]|nr:hypothetical protein [Paenibacillus sp. OAS669]
MGRRFGSVILNLNLLRRNSQQTVLGNRNDKHQVSCGLMSLVFYFLLKTL